MKKGIKASFASCGGRSGCGRGWRNPKLAGGLDNVFDGAYRIHGSGIDAVGRNAGLGAHLRF